MKHILYSMIGITAIAILLMNTKGMNLNEEVHVIKADEDIRTIAGVVQPGETMETIFSKYNLNKLELFKILRSSRDIYNLSRLNAGNFYLFEVDGQNRIHAMQYGIDDMSYLKLTRVADDFGAEELNVKYTKKLGSLYVKIYDNLILSMPSTHKEYIKLAIELSDIYAWDIDFSTDIRDGDTVKILFEELWVGDVFKGFGNILAAEFTNNGTVHTAYRFEYDGFVDYYDINGKSVRKTLLRSPLKYKHISSFFSKRRYHPITRTYRPHLGIDYVAPTGTPVSAAGDGTVLFAGYKGQNGKMIRIKHKGGFETYYGHLSKIPKRIRKGVKVSQGDIIGYVGATGFATGPHLDYRIKLNGRFVNPLKVKLPRSKFVPKTLMADFRKVVNYLNMNLASLNKPFVASSGKEKISI